MARELDDILDIESADPVTTISTPSKVQSVVTKAQTILSSVKQTYDMVFEEDVDPRFEEDFEEVRDSLKDMITEISEVVGKLSLIAQDSEKASHFTAMATLSTTLLNANKQLLEIYSEKKKYMKRKETSQGGGDVNIQNAVFTGTTADLKKFLEEVKNSNS